MITSLSREFVKDLWVGLLSLTILAGFFVNVYLVLSGKIQTSDPNMLLLIGNVTGYTNALATMVAAYYYGSSKSSRDKDTTIATMASHQSAKDAGA